MHNGCIDALTHAYFSGLNVGSLGYDIAKSSGDAHKDFPGNPSNENEMDLYNNDLGRDMENTILSNGPLYVFQVQLRNYLASVGHQNEFKLIFNETVVYGNC